MQNQGLSVAAARRLARQLSPYDITWFEEPIHHNDFDGFERLSTQSNIPLAMGEREYNTNALMELSRRNSVDFWQPDVIRIGGVERIGQSRNAAGAFDSATIR